MNLRQEMEAERDPSASAAALESAFNEAVQDEPPDFARILNQYDWSNADVRATINDTLISLCGWSLHALIRRANGEVD